jgi:hypothetical protein
LSIYALPPQPHIGYAVPYECPPTAFDGTLQARSLGMNNCDKSETRNRTPYLIVRDLPHRGAGYRSPVEARRAVPALARIPVPKWRIACTPTPCHSCAGRNPGADGPPKALWYCFKLLRYIEGLDTNSRAEWYSPDVMNNVKKTETTRIDEFEQTYTEEMASYSLSAQHMLPPPPHRQTGNDKTGYTPAGHHPQRQSQIHVRVRQRPPHQISHVLHR